MFGFRAGCQDKLPLPAGPNHCLLSAQGWDGVESEVREILLMATVGGQVGVTAMVLSRAWSHSTQQHLHHWPFTKSPTSPASRPSWVLSSFSGPSVPVVSADSPHHRDL